MNENEEKKKLTMFNFSIPPPLITREHGSWAVLIVPMLVSAAVVGKCTIDFLLLAMAAFLLFLAYVPAQVVLREFSGMPQRPEKLRQARFWGTGYGLATLCIAVPLLLKGHPLLFAFGIVGIFTFVSNFYLTKAFGKTIATDLIAVAGLALSGPGTYYVLTGDIDRTAASLYLLNFLFFGCSVFYVHMEIRASAAKNSALSLSGRISQGKLNLLYHAAVVVIIGILATVHLTPAVAILAFVPMLAHAVYGTLTLSRRVRFKKLGFILLGQSLLFGMLLSHFV